MGCRQDGHRISGRLGKGFCPAKSRIILLVVSIQRKVTVEWSNTFRSFSFVFILPRGCNSTGMVSNKYLLLRFSFLDFFLGVLVEMAGISVELAVDDMLSGI